MTITPHIGIVSIGYPPTPHVSGFRAHGFATALAAIGCDVTVITSSSDVTGLSLDMPIGITDDSRAPAIIRAPLDVSRQWPACRTPLVLYRHFSSGHAHDWVRAARSIAAVQFPRGTVFWGIHGGASAHELARRLSSSSGGSWIADFKDDWLPQSTRRIMRAIDLRVERRRILSAAACTAASTLQATDTERLLHVHTTPIYTGVDLAQWMQTDPAHLGSTFNIVYTGHLSPSMDIRTMTDGFRLARESFRDDVRIHYFGTYGDQLEDALTKAGCHTLYIDHGWVSHAEAARYQRAADLLLYLPLVRSPNVPVKYLEYLASQRPLLSVQKERDARFRELQSTTTGSEVAQSPRQFADLLMRTLEAWRVYGRAPDQPRNLAQFTWKAQAALLFDVIQRVRPPTSSIAI